MTTKDLTAIDEIYFGSTSWETRLAQWVENNSASQDSFVVANAALVAESMFRGEAALAMVVNIPAAALISFLQSDNYMNTYELKTQFGFPASSVNERRQRVDRQLFPAPRDPKDFYFGAAALGGTGVRFYGEYCMVLSDIPEDTQVFDRNSWDIECAPLSEFPRSSVVSHLTGAWSDSVVEIATLKVLPQLIEGMRLATTGTVSDALLNDESFIEVHLKGKFSIRDVREVRERVASVSIESHLANAVSQGHAASLEESIWMARRQRIRGALATKRVRTRVAETSGRTR